jgi:CRISPR/Cas system CMR subunit Cmr6 (Cas7 group RAMP superfamily)
VSLNRISSSDKVNNLRGSAKKVLFPLVTGLGVGTVFQVGYATFNLNDTLTYTFRPLSLLYKPQCL